MPRPHRSQRDSGSGGQPVNSELPEDGPAGYGITGDELLMAVARDPVSGEANNAPVEDIFRHAQIAAQADQLLIDGDWQRVEPEQRPRWRPVGNITH